MTTTRPEVVRVTDTTTADELAEALTNVCHRARREMPTLGTVEHPTPWDRRHALIDDLLTDWEAAT